MVVLLDCNFGTVVATCQPWPGTAATRTAARLSPLVTCLLFHAHAAANLGTHTQTTKGSDDVRVTLFNSTSSTTASTAMTTMTAATATLTAEQPRRQHHRTGKTERSCNAADAYRVEPAIVIAPCPAAVLCNSNAQQQHASCTRTQADGHGSKRTLRAMEHARTDSRNKTPTCRDRHRHRDRHPSPRSVTPEGLRARSLALNLLSHALYDLSAVLPLAGQLRIVCGFDRGRLVACSCQCTLKSLNGVVVLLHTVQQRQQLELTDNHRMKVN